MTIFRDFQGPRRDIGIARPRHSKTIRDKSYSSLETSSSGLHLGDLTSFISYHFVFAEVIELVNSYAGFCSLLLLFELLPVS